jgi:hypothetical protein
MGSVSTYAVSIFVAGQSFSADVLQVDSAMTVDTISIHRVRPGQCKRRVLGVNRYLLASSASEATSNRPLGQDSITFEHDSDMQEIGAHYDRLHRYQATGGLGSWLLRRRSHGERPKAPSELRFTRSAEEIALVTGRMPTGAAKLFAPAWTAGGSRSK